MSGVAVAAAARQATHCIAPAISSAMPALRRSVRGVRRWWSVSKSEHSQSSMTMHRLGGLRHAPMKVMMCGCDSDAMTCSSSRYSCFSASEMRVSNNVLSATGSSLYQPSYTTPTPPPPISAPSSMSRA